MKKCFKCGVEKDIGEFYKHPMMADGHLGKCKECSKKDVTENRRAKEDYYKMYDMKRANLPKRVRARKEYAQTEKGRDANNRSSRKQGKLHPETKKKWSRNNPRAVAAETLFRNYIRYHRELRQPCEICGAERVHAHHEDYNKPLEVRWLCPKHHRARHKEMKELGIVP